MIYTVGFQFVGGHVFCPRKTIFGKEAPTYSSTQQGINFYDEVRRFEVNLIKQVLFHTNGKQSAAASLLNLNATILHSKIKFYGIEMPIVVESKGLLLTSNLFHDGKETTQELNR